MSKHQFPWTNSQCPSIDQMSKHQFARDKDGRWMNAQKTVYDKKSRYFCECPQRHILKLVKPSGRLGKRTFCDYFAHVTKRQKLFDLSANEKGTIVRCCGSGESLEHRMAKHRLRELQGLFTFEIQRCPCCREVAIEEDCSGGTIKIEVRSVDGKWRYDCLLVRNDGSKLALEIVHMHYTTDAKVQATRLSGIEIAEFRASEVLDMSSDGGRLNNLLVREANCINCLVKKGMEWLRDIYVEEFWIMWDFERIIEEGYFTFEKRLLKKIELKRLSDEADLKWMLLVWEKENDNIKELERDIATDYISHWNMLEFRKRITGLSSLEKAKLIIREYMGEFYIIHPNFSDIQLSKIWKEDENGLYFKRGDWYGGGIGEPHEHNDIYIYLFDNDRDIKGNQWKPDGVERRFVMFLRTFKVIGDLPVMEHKIRNNHDTHEFKDCKWPILKQLEKTFFGGCANCGIPGHTSESCRQKCCVRCGRKGHLMPDCFARKHVNGGLM